MTIICSSIAGQGTDVQLCPTGVKGCRINGEDAGNCEGIAAEETCTAALLELPNTHD